MSQEHYHSRPLYRLLATALAAVILAGCRPAPPPDLEVLIDNSRSLHGDLPQAIGTCVVEKAGAWVQQAPPPGSRFRIWIFAPDGEYAAQEYVAYTMPTLKAPAFKHRARFTAEMKADLERRLQCTPFTHRGSPVIEAIGHVTHVRDLSPKAGYHLVVISDLMQTSPRLELTPLQLARQKDSVLITRMRGIAPIPQCPPARVTFITYPGFTEGKKPLPDRLHQRICRLFEELAAEWTGGPTAVARESIR